MASDSSWRHTWSRSATTFIALLFLSTWIIVGLLFMWRAQVAAIRVAIFPSTGRGLRVELDRDREDIRQFIEAVYHQAGSTRSVLLASGYNSLETLTLFFSWAHYFSLPDGLFVDGEESPWTAVRYLAVFKDELDSLHSLRFCRSVTPRGSAICSVRSLAGFGPTFQIRTQLHERGDSIQVQILATSVASAPADPAVAMVASFERIGFALTFEPRAQRGGAVQARRWIARVVLPSDMRQGAFHFRVLTVHESGALQNQGMGLVTLGPVR